LKFHGTNTAAVESIISTGFLKPEAKKKSKSMFGEGIYFASDSSKSAQDRYTRGSNMLLVCDVLLGKTFTVSTAMHSMTGRELNRRGYDSLFAKRGTKGTGGVLNDEFVVYSPDQALPRYIVHYDTIQYREAPCTAQLEQAAIASGTDFIKHTLVRKKDAQPGDPFDFHFSIAESQFRRLMQKVGLQYVIGSVDYYINLSNIDRFNKAVATMKQKYAQPKESKKQEFTLEFCSVKSQSLDPIMSSRNSSDAKLLIVDGPLGTGVYFSDYPDAIRQDSSDVRQQQLLLCKVLQGNSYICTSYQKTTLPEGYDSLRFNSDEISSSGNELVILDTNQILPLYVINFK